MLKYTVNKNVERNTITNCREFFDGKEEEKNGYHCEHKLVFAGFAKELDGCNKFFEQIASKNVDRL